MLGAWTKSKKSKLTYKKELLPCDDYVKWLPSSGGAPMPLRIRRQFLDKLVSDFEKFQQVGVRVPLFKTHAEDPDNDRGTVKKLLIEKNKNGKDALFGIIEFSDEDAAKQGTRVDVSVMCPPEFVDGRGNKYEYPLRHVALTSSPVIPGLSAFEPVVLAFDPAPAGASQEMTQMNEKIDAILVKLGITAPENADPLAKLDLILAELTDEDESAAQQGSLNLSFPPVMVNQFKKNREGILDNLVVEGVLTPAIADDWRKRYCSSEALTCDLKLSSGDGETEFDRMVDAAKKMTQGRGQRGRMPSGSMTLSHGDGDDKHESATVRLMKKRAAAVTK